MLQDVLEWWWSWGEKASIEQPENKYKNTNTYTCTFQDDSKQASSNIEWDLQSWIQSLAWSV